MRLATYNVEWFESLFDQQDRLRADGEWSGRQDVTRAEQAEALALVFRRLDADAVMIVELDKVTAPDLTSGENAALIAAVARQASQQLSQDIFNAYANAIRSETEITIDQQALNAVHAQFQ